MDWRTENAKDTQLLDLRGLTPLDASAVAADGGLVAMAEAHNERLKRASDRVRHVVADRQRVADPSAWLDAEYTDIATPRCCVRRDSWDAILGLRRIFVEREAILGEMTKCLRDRYDSACEEHRAAVTAAEKRLDKERRRLEQANYGTAGGHFAALVADQEPVAEAARKVAAAREAFESVASARRDVGGDLTAVAVRQREMFAAMVD